MGIIAAILAARKLAEQDSTRPSSASNSAIFDAVKFAETDYANSCPITPEAS
jgi:hypothetical protein